MQLRILTIHIILTYIYIYIWANYNNSLTWIKAIWGWFLLLYNYDSRVRSQWGRYNLPRYIQDIILRIYKCENNGAVAPGMDGMSSNGWYTNNCYTWWFSPTNIDVSGVYPEEPIFRMSEEIPQHWLQWFQHISMIVANISQHIQHGKINKPTLAIFQWCHFCFGEFTVLWVISHHVLIRLGQSTKNVLLESSCFLGMLNQLCSIKQHACWVNHNMLVKSPYNVEKIAICCKYPLCWSNSICLLAKSSFLLNNHRGMPMKSTILEGLLNSYVSFYSYINH